VLALCEAFDALTTDRPFRKARTARDALRVMATELVLRFDPELLDLMPRVIEPLLD
jgi:putative two-component system response regulator